MSTAESRRQRNKAQDDEDAAQLKLGPEFVEELAGPLGISEVRILLSSRVDATTDNPVYKKTLEYVDTFSRFTERDTVVAARNMLQNAKDPLKPFELVQIANLCPLESEEAKALIPSLSERDDDELQGMLNELNSLRKSQMMS